MSYHIDAYLVDLDALRGLIGSGDADLLANIRAERAVALESVDEIEEDEETTCAEALGELIGGDPSEDVPGYLYGHAFRLLCEHVGEALPEFGTFGGKTNFVGQVDDALRARGVPLELSDLVFSGSPIRFPEPGEFPLIGHWTPAMLAGAADAFASIDCDDPSDDIAETLEILRAWVRRASEVPSATMIGFFT